MTDPVVILGSGLAGFAVARELRKVDRAVPVVVATSDDGAYYSKPTLSNALAAGKSAASLVLGSREQMAEQLGIRIAHQTRIERIDTVSKEVSWRDGALRYKRLVLALGADPVKPMFEGDGADEVLQVNDLSDYARFREKLVGTKTVVVIGAGLVGCEFANDLAATGVAVIVVDVLDVPLARFCPSACGNALRAALHAAGVQWRLGCEVRAVNRSAGRLEVSLSSGDLIACDLVLAAIGLKPRTTLAADASINVRKGIATDECLATSAPDVFAIGDCGESNGRLQPFVMPIMAGARALALTLLDRRTPVDYPPMPIVVKTPVCPMTVLPPNDGTGEWSLTGSGMDYRATFRDASGTLRGFALVGAASRDRQKLVREMAH